jgi:protein gp37
MSAASKIEWTDATWNPLRGCQKISPGCKHCYAETFAERFRGVPGHPYERGFDLQLVPHKLLEPLSWSTPRAVFVNSMSDLFQDGVPDKYVAAVAKIMMACSWHTFQVLTKRSERMQRLLQSQLRFASEAHHIWWGVSVEDRKYGLPRIDHLRASPAAVRFLSIEPLLEDLGPLSLDEIHWVIVGGESGPGARPLKEAWIQRILTACEAKEVPFFFKQWGGVQKKRHGRLLNGRTYDASPPYVTNPIPGRKERLQIASSLSHLVLEFKGRSDEKAGIRQAAGKNAEPTPQTFSELA